MKGFDLKYLFVGAGLEDWYKAIGTGWRLIVVGMIIAAIIYTGMCLWVNTRPKKNINQPVITVASGGTSNYTVVQATGKKERPWWIPSPFVEVFGQKTSDRDMDTGIRFGGRWEWN